jgi:spectinomycin phosphotransferase
VPQGGDPVVCWYPLNKGIGEIARTPLLPYYRAPLLPLYHTTAGNFLVDADDTLYIIDWDNPILAPKERDLMFIGGAQGFRGYSAQEEEILFYRGYGQTQIDPIALAYYRFERIVEDIAIYCEQLLSTQRGGEDREQSLHYLKSNFLPNGTIEIAHEWNVKMREG